jgi:hypothetical protein
VAITAVVVALTACAFAAAGDHQTLATIQRLDDAWLRHLPGHDKAEHVNWRGSART